jgi:DNA-binding NtrC family response regulator
MMRAAASLVPEQAADVALLITARTPGAVETLARHIHATGPRAGCRFVHARACDFPSAPAHLTQFVRRLLDRAAGGTVLVSAVDQMPSAIQETVLDVIDALESARRPSPPARVISGTTESLIDWVAAGTFSERLFYRLNVIHVMIGDEEGGNDPDVAVPSASAALIG